MILLVAALDGVLNRPGSIEQLFVRCAQQNVGLNIPPEKQISLSDRPPSQSRVGNSVARSSKILFVMDKSLISFN